ncbi:hypothetical protein [Enterobacter mori]|uniref:SpaN/EivJ family type III secretion system needle length determinant n=1 Tax=Enterobacter mori TaxID=539813 RepID=UPI001B8D77D8|nr:hypothetical protein [Enterobacter mori]MBS3050409.1 hypothetical protein [Enterobacter mori]
MAAISLGREGVFLGGSSPDKPADFSIPGGPAADSHIALRIRKAANKKMEQLMNNKEQQPSRKKYPDELLQIYQALQAAIPGNVADGGALNLNFSLVQQTLTAGTRHKWMAEVTQSLSVEERLPASEGKVLRCSQDTVDGEKIENILLRREPERPIVPGTLAPQLVVAQKDASTFLASQRTVDADSTLLPVLTSGVSIREAANVQRKLTDIRLENVRYGETGKKVVPQQSEELSGKANEQPPLQVNASLVVSSAPQPMASPLSEIAHSAQASLPVAGAENAISAAIGEHPPGLRTLSYTFTQWRSRPAVTFELSTTEGLIATTSSPDVQQALQDNRHLLTTESPLRFHDEEREEQRRQHQNGHNEEENQ